MSDRSRVLQEPLSNSWKHAAVVFDEVPVAPPRTRTLLLRLFVCVAVLAVLSAVVTLALRAMVAPVFESRTTEYGTCPPAGTPCTSVPIRTIERVSGVRLPDHARVLASEAIRDPLDKRRTVTAWVRLPATTLDALRVTAGEGDPAWASQRNGYGNVLRAYHAEIEQFNDADGTTLALGKVNRREVVLFIHTTMPEPTK